MRMNRAVWSKSTWNFIKKKYKKIFFFLVRRVRCFSPEWFACKWKWHNGRWRWRNERKRKWETRKHLPHQLYSWSSYRSVSLRFPSHQRKNFISNTESTVCVHTIEMCEHGSLRHRDADSIQTNDWKLNTFAVAGFSFFLSFFLFVSLQCNYLHQSVVAYRSCMIRMLRLSVQTKKKIEKKRKKLYVWILIRANVHLIEFH